MHDNDMAKRQNKDVEDKMAIVQEKLNEHLSTIYKYEIQIEKYQLDMDAFNTEKQGIQKEKDHFKVEHDKIVKDVQIGKVLVGIHI
jgi:hypothetical protein